MFKSLITIAATALFVVACSQHSGKKDVHHKNPELAKAIKVCHSETQNKDMQTFEACLKQKGFEKPANHPSYHRAYHTGHKHQNPALAKAMKECHHQISDKMNLAQFESCLAEKGFKKPANHP